MLTSNLLTVLILGQSGDEPVKMQSIFTGRGDPLTTCRKSAGG